jgi:hypothetical protein
MKTSIYKGFSIAMFDYYWRIWCCLTIKIVEKECPKHRSIVSLHLECWFFTQKIKCLTIKNGGLTMKKCSFLLFNHKK